jgi:alkanesulfonate monooxygenase SsuD/methylene tetrahydromethanopterin reductase-like flavin-dependent oxidoreductase (luciferase family)
MKFGMFYLLQASEPRTPQNEYQRFWEAVEEVTYAEEMGFEYAWFAEHHFVPDWSFSSTPEITLTALSQRTSTMRLGFAVALLPIHHPLRLAAQVATMDILSNGRVDFGVGRSKNLWQLAPFGVGLEEGRGRMVESLSIIPKMWTEEVFSHEGHYYQIPPREIVPKPIQQPHPPIWAACTQEETQEIAGAMGIGCLLNAQGGIEKTTRSIAVYREAIKDANPVGKFINNQVMLSIMAHCDENHQRALDRGSEIGAWARNTSRARMAREWEGVDINSVPDDYRTYALGGNWVQSRGGYIPVGQEDAINPEEFLKTHRGFLIGDPDTCIETLEQYEKLGVDGVMCSLQQGPTTHEEAINTIRLFGKYVIPHFKRKEQKSVAAQN